MQFRTGRCQHIGGRAQQQDGWQILPAFSHGGLLVAVADGMGGLKHGREASAAALAAFASAYGSKSSEEDIPDALRRALESANEALLRAAGERSARENMGTTLAAAVLLENGVHWISVGDSRIYLWRRGRLIQLTADHIYGAQLDEQAAGGEISREQAQGDPHRGSLTSFLGASAIAQIDASLRPLALRTGDRVVVCSDGVYSSLSEREMALALGGEAELGCQLVVEKILARELGDQDNLTVIAVSCDDLEGPAEPPPPPESSPSVAFILLCLAVLSAAGGWLAGQGLRAASDPGSGRRSSFQALQTRAEATLQTARRSLSAGAHLP